MSLPTDVSGMVLVTGRADCVASHVVQPLCVRGTQVLILDSLLTGFRSVVGDTPLIMGDVNEDALVGEGMFTA
jgi:UDP-glucose 4-epimerase